MQVATFCDMTLEIDTDHSPFYSTPEAPGGAFAADRG